MKFNKLAKSYAELNTKHEAQQKSLTRAKRLREVVLEEVEFLRKQLVVSKLSI